MRRSALLGTMTLPTILLLGGCSGLGKFFGDTITIPGMNPNLPFGVSENTDRSRGEKFDEAPILPDSGNVWPGPPQALPTLNDVSRDQGSDLSSGTGSSSSGSPPQGGHGGNAMHDGGSMSLGEGDQVAHGATSGADSFSGGGVLSDHIPDASSQYRTKPAPGKDGGKGGGKDGGNIVIPNGDGTSTVISPDGTVKTVNGTPK